MKRTVSVWKICRLVLAVLLAIVLLMLIKDYVYRMSSDYSLDWYEYSYSVARELYENGNTPDILPDNSLSGFPFGRYFAIPVIIALAAFITLKVCIGIKTKKAVICALIVLLAFELSAGFAVVNYYQNFKANVDSAYDFSIKSWYSQDNTIVF